MSIGEALKEMKSQVAEVQKSQDKMWGAISQMGEELRELAMREDSSDEEQEAGPEVSQEETAPTWIPCVAPEAPRTVTSPISPFGIPPKAPAVSFGTLDDASVRESVSSTVQQHSAAPKQDVGYPWRIYSLGRLPLRKREIPGPDGWITASTRGLHSVYQWRGCVLGGQTGRCGHDLCRGLCALDCYRWSSED